MALQRCVFGEAPSHTASPNPALKTSTLFWRQFTPMCRQGPHEGGKALGPYAAAVNRHCWLFPRWQGHWIRWAPLFWDAPSTSRHLPLCRATSR
jgi:hypothetical protein